MDLEKYLEKIKNSKFTILDSIKSRDGQAVILPKKANGEDGCWQLQSSTAQKKYENGTVKLVGNYPNYRILYLNEGALKEIKSGSLVLKGYDQNGAYILERVSSKLCVAKTVWNKVSHDASIYGSKLIDSFLSGASFSFPKSIYAVEDTLRFFVSNKPDALIVDFFAGSGTTAHATMLLNHLDGGHRRCISVTNNEIGPDNEKALTKQGLRPTDKEWQSKGIAHYITWERIKAAITGIVTNGEPVKGDYKFTEEFPMSDGFKENAVFCELTYEDLWDIRLDRAFNAVAPILWMAAGCKGRIIEKVGKCYAITDNYAVLFKYSAVGKFVDALKKKPSVEHVFVVTDDQQRYTNVVKRLYMINPQNIHRLYESYLKSFEILGEGGLD